jgi:hypothetical protein
MYGLVLISRHRLFMFRVVSRARAHPSAIDFTRLVPSARKLSECKFSEEFGETSFSGSGEAEELTNFGRRVLTVYVKTAKS